jgi:hypothetical protein
MSCRASWWNHVAFGRSTLDIDIEGFSGCIIAALGMVIVGLRRRAEIVGVFIWWRRFLIKA